MWNSSTLETLQIQEVGDDDSLRQVEVPVLYTLEELFLLSQPLNKRIMEDETKVAEEPPMKKLKPSRPLKRGNNKEVKKEALENYSEFQNPVEKENNTLNGGSISNIETLSELDNSEDHEDVKDLIESQRDELRKKEKMLDDLQKQFVIVQSENLYKDSELRDAQEKISSHLKTASELLKTINSMKCKVDEVTATESRQVRSLELKISQLEAENQAMKKNPTGQDHTDCEKKKKDLLIERLKIFHKLSEEEKLSARLLQENLDLKKNQEKLDKALKTFEGKIKEFTEDKKSLEAAKKQIKTLETERRDLMKEAGKEEDLRKRVESLESKVKKYKILLRNPTSSSPAEDDTKPSEPSESKMTSPILFSNFGEAWKTTEDVEPEENVENIEEIVNDVVDSDQESGVKSFDARMFNIPAIVNNNEKDRGDGKGQDDRDQLRDECQVDLEIEAVGGDSEEDKNSAISSSLESDMPVNSPASVRESSRVETEEDRESLENDQLQNGDKSDEVTEVDDLQDTSNDKLVIDLKDDIEGNASQDIEDDNLVIDLKEDTRADVDSDCREENEIPREESYEEGLR